MKKAIFALLTLVVLAGTAACGKTPDATVLSPSKTPDNGIEILSLAEYTIVYPLRYKEWQMEQVEILVDVIFKRTGTKIVFVPDKSGAQGKRIIFASSDVETAYSDTVKSFNNELDYIIGVDESSGDIILGGNNYYADMRAVYDFINNYIGYDDLNGKFTEATKKLETYEISLYEEPEFFIMGSNLNAAPFTAEWQVKDFADCNFNLLQIQSLRYEEHGVRDVAVWCARFGVKLLYYPESDKDAKSVIIPDEEDLIENPAVWGLYIVDEPQESVRELYNDIAKDAAERFEKYGWTIYVNTLISASNTIEYIKEDGSLDLNFYGWEDYYNWLDVFSFDASPYQNRFLWREWYTCLTWELAREVSLKYNQDLFIYIDSYNLANRGYNDKMFRSHIYMCLCFGAKAVEYFQYGDASPYYSKEGDWTEGSLVNWDFSKNEYWYDAQRVNKEVMSIVPILNQYENVGAYTIAWEEENFTYMYSPLDDFGAIEFINQPIGYDPQSLLVGCFEKKEGNGKAFILMTVDALNDFSYDSLTMPYSTIKINGDNVKFYRDGVEDESVIDNGDGTYKVMIANGACLFVTVD